MNSQLTRVLVVDDVAVLRLSVSKALREAGDFEVVGAARDGREALPMIDDHSPDLVILDLEMPVMSGLDVLQVLSEKPQTCPQRRFWFLGGQWHGADSTMQALSLGALDFVLKPQAKDGFSSESKLCQGAASIAHDGVQRTLAKKKTGTTVAMSGGRAFGNGCDREQYGWTGCSAQCS